MFLSSADELNCNVPSQGLGNILLSQGLGNILSQGLAIYYYHKALQYTTITRPWQIVQGFGVWPWQIVQGLGFGLGRLCRGLGFGLGRLCRGLGFGLDSNPGSHGIEPSALPLSYSCSVSRLFWFHQNVTIYVFLSFAASRSEQESHVTKMNQSNMSSQAADESTKTAPSSTPIKSKLPLY